VEFTTKCRLNGTHDIHYEDGDKEQGVLPECIRFPTPSITSLPKDHCMLLRLVGWEWNTASFVLGNQNLNQVQIQV
jgi:hypothetical protein